MNNKNLNFEYIFELPVNRLAKLVYIYLFSIADDKGKCSISLSDIAKKCDIKTRQTVLILVNELKDIGIINIENRKNDKGAYMNNVYTIFDKPKK